MTDSAEQAILRIRAQIEEAKTERFSKEPRTSKDDPRVMEALYIANLKERG